ncbi:hypothetical protein CAPTEDRAFT_216077 [Capitella teleta]|uniref:Uncharacterized protein n=1 Tax=Capitella teleta TaxID=283909 RepID=R7U011_CAPTE|nr:hypothetical protein CAPTEDRAFT_216077 [Capitella teleta]|eukprot:ELT96540.1 hypothetical protein CAPTEDRAFT_216077 [Capitella teleta]
MQATVQIRSGHVMPTDDDRLPSGDPHGPPDAVLPVLKSSSLLEGHHYDWGDNRRVLDRSMLAYSNHARQLTEHDSSSPVGRQWMMLPRMNRAHADADANESSLRASSDMTLMCADREVPVLSSFRTVSELPGNAANIMRHSPYHSKPKRYNSGLRDQPAVTQNDQGLATCGQQEVREPEVTSISIVPFPPPAVDTQIVISDSKISDGVKKSEKNKNAVKRAQFFKKGVLPPITKSKAKHKTDSAAEDGTTSPTRHLRMRKGKSTLVQGSCAPIHAKDNSHDIDEVLHANVNGNAESEPDQTNELWEKAARATGISNFQGRERGGGGGGGGSKTDSKPKQRKGFTPRVMKGTMNKKGSTPKKDDVIKDEEDADPQIKSVLKKKGNTYQEKSVKFGEELEFVRIVTKIEYPWYKESSSDDGEKDEEDTESSSDSSSSSSSSSSEDEEEKKKVKRKVRKKIPKKKCVKTNTSKSIIVDEMQGISSKSSPGRSCKSIESLSEGKKRASGLTKSDIEPGCYEPTNCQDTPPASVACKLRDDEVVPDCDEVVPADIDHSALSKNGHIAESSCEVVCETSDDLLVSTAVSTTADEIGSAEETPGTDINSLKCAEQNA